MYILIIYERRIEKYEDKEVYIKPGKELHITNDEDDVVYDLINQPDKKYDSLMRRAFKCTNVGYDSYGRVNSIKFEEKQWGDLN